MYIKIKFRSGRVNSPETRQFELEITHIEDVTGDDIARITSLLMHGDPGELEIDGRRMIAPPPSRY